MEFGGIGWNQKKMAMGKEKMVLVKKEEEEIGEFEQIGYLEEGKKKKGIVSGSGLGKKGSGGCVEMKNCQAEKCTADLIDAKQYHRRHKVCEHHAKAQVVLVAGTRQRFCQQCSRFHELSEFDETKRSCRKRLAGHNERRRKSSTESHAEGSSRNNAVTQLKDVCGQVDGRGSIQISVQESSAYKHFQIR